MVNSSKGGALAILVAQVSSRFGVDAVEGEASSVLFEALVKAPEGGAFTSSANVTESDNDELAETAPERPRRIRSRNRGVKRSLLSCFRPPFRVYLAL